MNDSHSYRYQAFISYSHRDEEWASWLHKSLETYRIPKPLVGNRTTMGVVPARLAPVFRDRDELASSTDLGTDLRNALAGSACQIVICSRASAQSHWVNEEILAFKRLGRSHRIFCLIVDGEPCAADTPGREDEECFPPALKYRMDESGELTDTLAEPIAADARPGRDGKSHVRLKLLAGLLGVGFDALRQREAQRRQRRLAAAAMLSSVGMVVAIGLATSAVIARNEAERQRVRAEQEAETARQTASFMTSLFEVSDPGEARGKTITAREILTAGAERIEEELGAQPTVQTRLMNTIGSVYTNLGLYGDARDMLTAALNRRRALASISDEELSRSLTELAGVLTETAELEQAEALYRESIARLEQAGAAASDAMSDSLAGLAEVYFRLGRFAEAEEKLRASLALYADRLDPAHPDVAIAELRLARVLARNGDPEEALALAAASHEKLAAALGDDHWLTAVSMSVRGGALAALGRFEEAEPLLVQSYEQLRTEAASRTVYIRSARDRLVTLYTRWGKPQLASRYRTAQA